MRAIGRCRTAWLLASTLVQTGVYNCCEFRVHSAIVLNFTINVNLVFSVGLFIYGAAVSCLRLYCTYNEKWLLRVPRVCDKCTIYMDCVFKMCITICDYKSSSSVGVLSEEVRAHKPTTPSGKIDAFLRRAYRYGFAANIHTVSELFDKAVQELFCKMQSRDHYLNSTRTKESKPHSTTAGTPVPCSCPNVFTSCLNFRS